VAAVFVSAIVVQGLGCASDGPKQEPRYTIIKNPEPEVEQSGIPADKQEEIQLVLKQREPSVRKCYQDVLNDKHDRGFQGTVTVLIHFEPPGKATDVRVIGSTLNSPEVEGCLAAQLKAFEYPELQQGGDFQHEYMFRPAF
jgi:hypothetical protein